MYLSINDQTIIAQCTPSGPGAIALVRLSGTDAFSIVEKMARLPQHKKITELPSHTIHYGQVIDKNNIKVDQVLFLLMRAPHTYTGQDVIEITCHNSPFIIENIIETALHHGARIASQGEFTRRAVENNKMDLTQAEAVHELIAAQTESALKKSLQQLEGSLSATIAEIETLLLKALAFSESSFEFIDEEMEFGNQIKDFILQAQHRIKLMQKDFDKQQYMRQGIRIALIGSVNAGKSSLFNALVRKKRAIVTSIAGTTRDTIEASVTKYGTFWTLIDTAGLRQTDDIIEQEGIAKSHQEAIKADIILLILDSSRIMNEEKTKIYLELFDKYHNKTIIVHNKIDNKIQTHLPQELTKSTISASIYQEETVIALENAIKEKIEQIQQAIDCPFLLTKRQYNLLAKLSTKLDELLPIFEGKVAYELVSTHLIDAIANLNELTGKSVSEAGMDMVFREFCVGK